MLGEKSGVIDSKFNIQYSKLEPGCIFAEKNA